MIKIYSYMALIVSITFVIIACDNPLGDLSTDSDHFPNTGSSEGSSGGSSDDSSGSGSDSGGSDSDSSSDNGDSGSTEPTLTVTSGLIVWLKAESLSSAIQGDSIPTWADQSGNSNDATQATSNLQPLYQNGTNGINGRPSLLFGDSGERTYVDTPSLDLTTRSIFMVLEFRGDPAYTVGPVFLHKDSSGTDDYGLDVTPTNEYTINYLGSMTSGTTPYNHEVVIVTTVIDTNQITVYVDGAQDSQDTSAVGSTQGVITLGGDQGANVINGEIAEVLIYNKAVDSTERSSIESYLNDKYSAF